MRRDVTECDAKLRDAYENATMQEDELRQACKRDEMCLHSCSIFPIHAGSLAAARQPVSYRFWSLAGVSAAADAGRQAGRGRWGPLPQAQCYVASGKVAFAEDLLFKMFR